MTPPEMTPPEINEAPALDLTHDPTARSWLASANADGGDFTVQNLPFAVFRRAAGAEAFRGGVALGDQVIDLAALNASGCLQGLAAQAAAACARPALNDFFALGPAAWSALRHALFGLVEGNAASTGADAVRAALVPQAEVEFSLPARIGDYTDFYTSFHHADNIGRLFNPGASVVVPANFHWMPIAYHGRASSVVVSGTPVRRPLGQSKKRPDADAPTFGACAWLDYELELGLWVGGGNALGEPVPLGQAESRLFGVCLLNDWSARDIQGWEMTPLGPFQAKNFATSVSPWIVTLDALAPYRQPWRRDAALPQPLPYLDSDANRARGALDIRLEVRLESAARRARGLAPVRLTTTSFRHQHWTIAQMLAHHTASGCNLQPGDLLGTGTISGPTPGEAGAMMELSHAGRRPLRLGAGSGDDDAGDGSSDVEVEERGFLADGDAVIFNGWCEAPGRVRIGFGECRGLIVPAVELPA